MNSWKRPNLIAILAIGLLCFGAINAQQDEYTMKAVFLEHFTRFIEWPESYESTSSADPFLIAVIGENPFDSILEKIYSDQKIKNRNVEIISFSSPEDITDCHILFISRSNKEILPEILHRTEKKPILTVSDTQGFAKDGVLINFYMTENKIKFEINERAVQESGLTMSYRLLSLARIVNKERPR